MPRSHILATLFCLFPSIGSAAQIEFAPAIDEQFVVPFTWETMEGMVPQLHAVDFSHLQHIRVVGPIEPGDAQRLVDLVYSDAYTGSLQDISQQLIVSFDSPGGSYQEGLALSDAIQMFSAATYVGPGDSCLSACALAWLGGRKEVIRQVMWTPSRYMHDRGELGFHAPFNREYPEGVSDLGQAGVELVADLFYELARESIRELQARMPGWQVRPEFVVEFLGRGADEFLMLDRTGPLFANGFTLLSENSRHVRQIGALEAYAVCDYALKVSVAPADDYRMISNPGLSWDYTDPEDLRAAGTGKGTRMTLTADARDRLVVEDFIPGRGDFTCQVENDLDGWVVRLEGDVPLVETALGNVPQLTENANFFVTEHNALGLQTPWAALQSDDLLISTDPFAAVPAEFLRDKGPSFDCGGELDKAAEVICAFPVLARADAIMVAAYGAKRDGEGVRDAQRQWVGDRNRACRVAGILKDEQSSFRMAGYCLLAYTLARIDALTKT